MAYQSLHTGRQALWSAGQLHQLSRGTFWNLLSLSQWTGVRALTVMSRNKLLRIIAMSIWSQGRRKDKTSPAAGKKHNRLTFDTVVDVPDTEGLDRYCEDLRDIDIVAYIDDEDVFSHSYEEREKKMRVSFMPQDEIFGFKFYNCKDESLAGKWFDHRISVNSHASHQTSRSRLFIILAQFVT